MTKKERLKQALETSKVKKSEIEEIGLTQDQIKEYEIEVENDMPETIEEYKERLQSLEKALADKESHISKLNEENKDKRLNTNEYKEKYEALLNENKELKTAQLSKAELNSQYESELNELREKAKQLESLSEEKTALETKVNSYVEKEQALRLAKLEKLPQDKRDLFENASIEIIEEFISSPKNSQGIEKSVTTAQPVNGIFQGF